MKDSLEARHSQFTARDGTRKGSLREFGGRVALAVALGVFILGLTALIAFSLHVWFALFAGILIAIFVRTLSDRLARWTHLGEKWAVTLVFLSLLAAVGLLVWWASGPITREAGELQERLPKAVAGLRQQLSGLGVHRFLDSDSANVSSLFSKAGGLMSGALGAFMGTLSSLVTLLIIFFTGIYLSLSPATYVRGLIALFPPAKRRQMHRLLSETGLQLRYWIFGQLVSMVAVGAMITLGLYVSGVPVPIVLGIFAGLLDIIPIFGPVAAAIPAILLGFTVSPWHALYAIITFVVANQIEQHLLIPIVQRYSISLPPALTIFALFLLGSLFGFWGMLLAVPITAAAIIIVKRGYIEHVLHDYSRDDGSPSATP